MGVSFSCAEISVTACCLMHFNVKRSYPYWAEYNSNHCSSNLYTMANWSSRNSKQVGASSASRSHYMCAIPFWKRCFLNAPCTLTLYTCASTWWSVGEILCFDVRGLRLEAVQFQWYRDPIIILRPCWTSFYLCHSPLPSAWLSLPPPPPPVSLSSLSSLYILDSSVPCDWPPSEIQYFAKIMVVIWHLCCLVGIYSASCTRRHLYDSHTLYDHLIRQFSMW